MATQRSRTVGVTKGASGTCALVCMAVMVGACREAVPLPVDLVQVEMTAHKADWKAAYQLANADGTVRAIDTGREVHVPIGSTVTLMMTSAEYIATFDAPGLGLRDFAAPGLPGTFEFHATASGRFEVRADEMCGLPHPEQFVGAVVVESADAYRAWVRERMKQES